MQQRKTVIPEAYKACAFGCKNAPLKRLSEVIVWPVRRATKFRLWPVATANTPINAAAMISETNHSERSCFRSRTNAVTRKAVVMKAMKLPSLKSAILVYQPLAMLQAAIVAT